MEMTLTDRANETVKLGASVEVVGSWLWAEFPARPPRETLNSIKALDYHWNKKRKLWQFAGRPCGHSRLDSNALRLKYGSVAVVTDEMTKV